MTGAGDSFPLLCFLALTFLGPREPALLFLDKLACEVDLYDLGIEGSLLSDLFLKLELLFALLFHRVKRIVTYF